MDVPAFWAFADHAWSTASVREPLLRWQDEERIDVMFLLFACWYPRRLPPTHWAFLRTGSGHWHACVTARMRRVRRRLKQHAWREGHGACLKLELKAEHVASEWLCRMSAGPISHTVLAPNFEQRLRRLFPALPPVELRALVDICALIPQQTGACPATDPHGPGVNHA